MEDRVTTTDRTPSAARFAKLALALFILRSFRAPPPRMPKTPQAAPAPQRDAAASSGRPAPSLEPGLWPALKRAAGNFSRHRIMALSAEMTFYSLLALFPALAALVSLYGLFSNPAALQSQIDLLKGVMPSGGVDIVSSQIKSLTSAGQSSLSIGFAVGLAAAIWSANSSIKSAFDAFNVVYEIEETRSFIKLTAISLAITCGMLIAMTLAILAMVAVPIALSFIKVGLLGAVVSIGRWPLLLLVVALILALLYKVGPDRAQTWRSIAPGAAFGGVGWLVVSMLFSWYVSNFGSYNKTYGSLGAAVGFMTWMWISGMVILLGAEINSQLEAARTRAPGRKLQGGAARG